MSEMKSYINYPFNAEYILRNKKKIKKNLLSANESFIEKRIAILGGSTTGEIKNILEIFLLNYGIKPYFYESDYNKFYEDAIFGNKALDDFSPEIIYIHTTNRNINNYPDINDSIEEINLKLSSEYNRFCECWNSLCRRFDCIIIQNNFEYPYYRLLGNKDATDIHGNVNFLTKLNLMFAEYSEKNDNFFINDINYLSAQYGLDKWSEQAYWYMYKYALCFEAIPTLAFSVASIIKAVFGKNKKALVLDLDNTLWGGVVGDDGVDNLEIGSETPQGEAYFEFQKYIKTNKQLGVLLNINSKNDIENAYAGLEHPESVLHKDDFIEIKANWNPKSKNLYDIAKSLNLGIDSLVFVDDNPAEREIINQQFSEVRTPDIGNKPEQYIKIIDHNNFFECASISDDDYLKSEMYVQNKKRISTIVNFNNYDDYLQSLNMVSKIAPFESVYLKRITQLINKSNQFNLTTKRYSLAEIESIANNKDYITLYGKLADKYGDNGVVSVLIGKIKNDTIDIELFLMSCRVLKRGLEQAMMDCFINRSKEFNIKKIYGYYYPTKKNALVKTLYKELGFTQIYEDEQGYSKWELYICNYKTKNRFIKLEDQI